MVVTSIGAVTRLGGDIATSLKKLIKGASRAKKISRFDSMRFPFGVACEVPIGKGESAKNETHNPIDWFSQKDLKKGDGIELKAISRAFTLSVGHLSLSSTKSPIGHLLGAMGAVEAIFSILSEKNNIVPPTINLDDLSIDTKIDLVPHESKEKEINSVLSNSFGFGGMNVSVIFSRY